MKKEIKRNNEVRQVIIGLKYTALICLFLTVVSLVTILVELYVLNEVIFDLGYSIYVSIFCWMLACLFLREYLDIKKYGLEWYKQKWYYV